MERKKDGRTEYVPGELLVKFKPGTEAYSAEGLHSALGSVKKTEFKKIKVHRIKLPDTITVDEAVQWYKQYPDVEYAEPNFIVHTLAVPDDQFFGNLWGLNNTGETGGTSDADIDAPEAWDITTGSHGVVIAVIDSGVAFNHPDFSDNIWMNTGEINCADGADNDVNGYIDDCYGWDFGDSDNDPTDYHGHGTHVAGTIAAQGNNNEGITGVMWDAKIMPLKFLGVSGNGTVADAASAVEYANNKGAHVINLSWGGDAYSQALKDVIDASPAVVVCSAGNSGTDNDTKPVYPASYASPNIIAVAATDYNDNLSYFSNYGTASVDLAAPGSGIYSTVPEFTYGARTQVYSMDFDGASGNLPLLGWERGGTSSTWAVTTGTGKDSSNSLEDSPGSNYQSNTNSWAGYMTPISSVRDNRYTLSFEWKGKVDPLTLDFLNINYSSNGIKWDWLDRTDGDTGGLFISYSTSEITTAADLLSSFFVGFGLKTDLSGNFDGVHIDNMTLIREPLIVSGYNYTYNQGSSMAVAHVSGVAGLILANSPNLTNLQVKETILNTVDTNPSLSGLVLTGGRLNAQKAVSNLLILNAPSGLTATAISSSQIDLSWVDNSHNEAGFRIERKTGTDGAYSEIDTVAADISIYSDTGLDESTTYTYRVRAYNGKLYSDYSNVVSATTPALSNGDEGGGGGGGGGCFIATAAFGSPLHPYVKLLRKFRDKHLLTNFYGRAFVELYYKYSPPIADIIKDSELLKAFTIIILTPVVMIVIYPYASVAILSVILLSLGIFFRRRGAH